MQAEALQEAVFLTEEVEAFLATDEAFFVEEDLLQEPQTCSTAMLQNSSSWPNGQPLFCQM